jgi:hypothetical protein
MYPGLQEKVTEQATLFREVARLGPIVTWHGQIQLQMLPHTNIALQQPTHLMLDCSSDAIHCPGPTPHRSFQCCSGHFLAASHSCRMRHSQAGVTLGPTAHTH